MNKDLMRAKALLTQGSYTCVLCREDVTHTSTQRGVAPLLRWLDAGVSLEQCSAADRVVGKATAFLYCLLGVKEVYARVMSKPAVEVLQKHGIPASWETLVEGIENRQKTGPCPMEYATRNCATAEEALAAVRQTLEALRRQG